MPVSYDVPCWNLTNSRTSITGSRPPQTRTSSRRPGARYRNKATTRWWRASWDGEVQKLLGAVETSTHTGLRDRALLGTFARIGGEPEGRRLLSFRETVNLPVDGSIRVEPPKSK